MSFSSSNRHRPAAARPWQALDGGAGKQVPQAERARNSKKTRHHAIAQADPCVPAWCFTSSRVHRSDFLLGRELGSGSSQLSSLLRLLARRTRALRCGTASAGDTYASVAVHALAAGAERLADGRLAPLGGRSGWQLGLAACWAATRGRAGGAAAGVGRRPPRRRRRSGSGIGSSIGVE